LAGRGRGGEVWADRGFEAVLDGEIHLGQKQSYILIDLGLILSYIEIHRVHMTRFACGSRRN